MHRHTHKLILTSYTLLSLILTWPLVTKMTTHVPGIAQWAFDESTFIWNIWYLKQSLVDQLSSPLHSELIWYPLGIDLVLYTYNFFHALIAQPLMLAVNLPFASNSALLLSTVLSGYGTFLLVYYLTRSANYPTILPAFVAGLLYAFASNRAIYAALGHYDMVTTQWIPFYALMLLRALDSQLAPSRRRKAALLAGLFFAFTGLAEMITAVFLAIFTLIVLFIYWRKILGKGWQTTIPTILLMGTVAFLLWSPVLLPILRQFLTNDFSLKGWGEAIPLSTDILGWLTPTMLHPLWGGDLIAELRRVQELAQTVDGTGFRDVNTVFLGWVTLTLACLGAFVYGKKIAVWLWTALIFGIFTLGPFLQINGRYRFDLDGVEATFPLPYALLHYIPIVKANRAPNRNSVLLMLGLAVLVGYGLMWLTEKLRSETKDSRKNLVSRTSNVLCIICAGLIIFEHLTLPLPLSDAQVPAVYAQIAADPQPVTVLNLPLGWRNSFGVLGPERTQLQYFQTVHGKPMLGGNISRAPDFKMGYFERIPFFHALTEIQFGRPIAPEVLETAQAQADELMALYNVGYVILHPPIPQRFPYADHWQTTWDFAKQTLPLENEPFWQQDGIEAYRIVQAERDDRFELDLGIAGTYPYRGEGWDGAEIDAPYGFSANWAADRQSRLFVPLWNVDTNATYTIQAQVHPFAYPGSPSQTVHLAVNGIQLSTEQHTLQAEWQEIGWDIPGHLLQNGLNRLTFHWGYAAAPRQVIGGSRQIGVTGVDLPIDTELKAFTDGGFIALFDESGEQIDASAGRRGVNVTVLDHDGNVKDKAGFDTAANQYESEKLADYLMTIDSGLPILVVSYGSAWRGLTAEAIEGLRNVGADVLIDDLQNRYFAIVGVQGAEAGSASVAVHENEAFLSVSLNRDRRTLAAAVDWIYVEKK